MVKEPTYRVTLARVSRVAGALYRIRALLSLAAIIAVVWFGFTLMGQAPSGRAMIPLTLILWSVLGLGVGHTLARLPGPARSGDRLGRRFRQRFLVAMYALAAGLMLVLAGFAVFLTVRTVGLAAA